MKKALALVSIIAALALAATPVLAFEDLYPTEAYDLVTSKAKAYIIDVRTPEEWKWVGHPGENWLGEGADLDGKVVNIPYLIFPGGVKTVNPTFVEEVDAIFGDIPSAKLVMMCRSGGRGVAAANALEAAGYNSHKIYNMLTGFEGGNDARGYRIINGWRFEGLPYAY
jgi:rhodanese-related sulfurtransferase